MRILIPLLALVWSVSKSAAGTTYYAAPNGSSGNSGISTNSPWPLGYAIANAGSSNTIFLLPGNYTYSSAIYVTTPYLAIKCSPKWSAVFTNITGVHPFYVVSPAHDITWDGLSFQNNQYDMQLGDQGNPGAVSNCVAKNCWVKGTGNAFAPSSSASGIETVCNSALVENCLLEWNGTNNVGQNHGIYTGGSNGIFRNNVCRFNGGQGIVLNGHNAGVCDNNNKFYNNLLYGNFGDDRQMAIKASGNTGTNYIFGNTLVEFVGSYAVICEPTTTCFLTNNIIISQPSSGINGSYIGTVYADYNMSPFTLSRSGPHDLVTNYFGFVNTNNGLYWLKSDSPARGKALAGACGPVNFFGNAQGSVTDIGAFQYMVAYGSDSRILDPSPATPDYWTNPAGTIGGSALPPPPNLRMLAGP